MKLITNNEKSPANEGIYHTIDSAGNKYVTRWRDGIWQSQTGHPVVYWIDEGNNDLVFSIDDIKEYGLACLEWAAGNRTEKPSEFLTRVHNIGNHE